MRKYLLPREGNFYKANLHCHSVYSDGQMTPQQLKETYRKMGYSVLAITDHDILIPHPELNDDSFLTLNGYEMEVNEPKDSPWADKRSCHMCLIALEEENIRQVCWHPEWYLFGHAGEHKDKVQFVEEHAPYVRTYSGEGVSDMMKKGRDHGFFVTYNHPTWSLENYDQYMNYHHMHAMEICNFGCVAEGYQEYNPRVYDDMLRGGKRIYCIGADDNHNWGEAPWNTADSGGAWVMIKAEKLHYRTITKALEDGHFYSSQGPEIRELWVEGDRICVTTSPAREIIFTCGNRQALRLKANPGEWLCEGSFEWNPSCGYVRVTVVDAQGRCADSNAYFTDDWL